MRKLVWIVAPLFLATASASAEIFKCAGKNGVIVYQNFRCEVDSLGSLPSNPRTTPAPAANQVKPTAVAMNSGTPQPTEPAIGMTAEEVRAIWASRRTHSTRSRGMAAASRCGPMAPIDQFVLITEVA